MSHASPRFGQITCTVPGEEGTRLVEVADGGWPVVETEEEIDYIPVAELPGVVPIWSIALPIQYPGGVEFTDEEAGELGLPLMWRRAAERRRAAPRRLSPSCALSVTAPD